MPKTKEDHLNDLAKIAFKIDDVLQKQQEKSERLTRMAQLARQGLKDSEEFKKLDREFKDPQFTSPSEELHELRIIVKRLRRWKTSSYEN
jgi:CHAD domain-containing protein